MWSLSRDNPLWSFMQEGIPSAMVVTTRDSKKQVDEALKKACEEFIGATAREASDPIVSFLVKVSAFTLKNEQSQEKVSLATQPFAQPGFLFLSPFGVVVVHLPPSDLLSPDQIKGLVDALSKQLEKVIPPSLAHIRKYLTDKDTEEVLFKAVKTAILGTYKQFYDLVRGNYDNRLVAQVWSGHDIKKRLDLLSSVAVVAVVTAAPDQAQVQQEQSKVVVGETGGVGSNSNSGSKENLELKSMQFRLGESPPLTPVQSTSAGGGDS